MILQASEVTIGRKILRGLHPIGLTAGVLCAGNKKVSTDYIKSILTWDLPPNTARLRNLREKLRKLRF
jgi:hypothetical protein